MQSLKIIFLQYSAPEQASTILDIFEQYNTNKCQGISIAIQYHTNTQAMLKKLPRLFTPFKCV